MLVHVTTVNTLDWKWDS